MPLEPAEIEEKLARVFRDMLDLAPTAPVEQVSRASMPEWDSLRHVKLLLEVQKIFKVRFSAPDFLRLASYREIRDELARR